VSGREVAALGLLSDKVGRRTKTRPTIKPRWGKFTANATPTNGARNPFYDSVRSVAPTDHFVGKRMGRRIGIVGAAISFTRRGAFIHQENADGHGYRFRRSRRRGQLERRDRQRARNGFQADWKRFGRKAGQMRNAEIVRNVVEVAAFWDGRSRGTLNTIMQATNAGVPVQVIDETGKTLPKEWVLDQAKLLGVMAGIEKARS
jgi:hypothetical protein